MLTCFAKLELGQYIAATPAATKTATLDFNTYLRVIFVIIDVPNVAFLIMLNCSYVNCNIYCISHTDGAIATGIFKQAGLMIPFMASYNCSCLYGLISKPTAT